MMILWWFKTQKFKIWVVVTFGSQSWKHISPESKSKSGLQLYQETPNIPPECRLDSVSKSWLTLPRDQSMLCGAKLRGKDAHCQKHGMLNGRCRLHGGLSKKSSDHWNYQGNGCTKEERQRSVETNAYIKFLEQLAISLGMIEAKW